MSDVEKKAVVRKTEDERISETAEKLARLRRRKQKRLTKESAKDRKKRTHELIRIGAAMTRNAGQSLTVSQLETVADTLESRAETAITPEQKAAVRKLIAANFNRVWPPVAQPAKPAITPSPTATSPAVKPAVPGAGVAPVSGH